MIQYSRQSYGYGTNNDFDEYQTRLRNRLSWRVGIRKFASKSERGIFTSIQKRCVDNFKTSLVDIMYDELYHDE